MSGHHIKISTRRMKRMRRNMYKAMTYHRSINNHEVVRILRRGLNRQKDIILFY